MCCSHAWLHRHISSSRLWQGCQSASLTHWRSTKSVKLPMNPVPGWCGQVHGKTHATHSSNTHNATSVHTTGACRTSSCSSAPAPTHSTAQHSTEVQMAVHQASHLHELPALAHHGVLWECQLHCHGVLWTQQASHKVNDGLHLGCVHISDAAGGAAAAGGGGWGRWVGGCSSREGNQARQSQLGAIWERPGGMSSTYDCFTAYNCICVAGATQEQ